jgi:hypothetical protein
MLGFFQAGSAASPRRCQGGTDGHGWLLQMALWPSSCWLDLGLRMKVQLRGRLCELLLHGPSLSCGDGIRGVQVRTVRAGGSQLTLVFDDSRSLTTASQRHRSFSLSLFGQLLRNIVSWPSPLPRCYPSPGTHAATGFFTPWSDASESTVVSQLLPAAGLVVESQEQSPHVTPTPTGLATIPPITPERTKLKCKRRGPLLPLQPRPEAIAHSP